MLDLGLLAKDEARFFKRDVCDSIEVAKREWKLLSQSTGTS